jgi:hypothetical protein
MRRRVRLFAVLLALAVLATGAVQAMPLKAGPVRASESEGVLACIWDWLSAFFIPDSGLKPAWEQDGSHGDPNGGNS